MIAAELPISVSQEAEDFVARQGLDGVFSEFLTGFQTVFPAASRITCELNAGVDEDAEPAVYFRVALPNDGPSFPTPNMRWSDWALKHFSGRELSHFVVLFEHGADENAWS